LHRDYQYFNSFPTRRSSDLGHDPEVAIGVAIPFAVAVQALFTLLFTALAPAMHKADQFALEANYRGIEWINYLGVAIHFIFNARSEEHTSELQSRFDLVCRL